MEVWKIKTKTDSKETKDKIIDLFYEKHLRPLDIARQLKVAKSYITKVIQKDSRYIEEKESRKAKNKEKNKIQKRVCAKNRREKEKQERQEYEKLMLLINNDNVILSTKKKANKKLFGTTGVSIPTLAGARDELYYELKNIWYGKAV